MTGARPHVPPSENTRGDDQPDAWLERRAGIIRLLETSTHGLPEETRRPMSTLGFVHRTRARESCPDCLANGFVGFGCETCGGRGYLEVRRGRDPYDTGQSAGWFGSSSARHALSKEREREIDRLGAQVEPPKTEAELLDQAQQHGEGWELARAAMRREFDYDALDRGLEALRLVDEDAYRALHAAHVYGYVTPSGVAAELVERGLALLSPWLPDPLRAPAAPVLAERLRPMTRAERDREVRRLEREGAARQWIAARFGLSLSRVSRIVNNEPEED